MSQTLSELMNNVLNSGARVLKDISSQTQYEDRHMFYVIGKPRGFRPEVDPYRHYSNYLRTKMTIIDIIPCHYNLYLDKFKEDAKASNFFEVSSIDAINKFKELCIYYGITDSIGGAPWSGVRLYTTDETTAADTFNITYHESFFQKFTDSLSNFARDVREVFKSLTSEASQITEQGINYAASKAGEKAQSLGVSESVAKKITEALSSLGSVALAGKRVDFPKVWENTTVSNTLTASVKLVSPYGHPEAIREFIIKPLMVLVLLASPRTTDGISYGGALPLNIRAYGIGYITLGYISNITIRRGGADTAFSVYKQPLWLDVSIEFQGLFEGCAVFAPSKYKEVYEEMGLAMDFNLVTPSSAMSEEVKVFADYNPLTTMGTILTSFMPVSSEFDDFQDYGAFSRPDRGEPYFGEGKGFTAGGWFEGLATKYLGKAVSNTLFPILKDVSDAASSLYKSVSEWGSSVINNVSSQVYNTFTKLTNFGGLF